MAHKVSLRQALPQPHPMYCVFPMSVSFCWSSVLIHLPPALYKLSNWWYCSIRHFRNALPCRNLRKSTRMQLDRKLGRPYTVYTALVPAWNQLIFICCIAWLTCDIVANWILIHHVIFSFQGCMAIMVYCQQERSWVAKLKCWVPGYTQNPHCYCWPHTLGLTQSIWWMCWHYWVSSWPSQGKSACSDTF